jgi:hypothetical protein
MDNQNRFEEVEKKESFWSKAGKYFKGLAYDFVASFKYNDLKLASWLIIIPGAIFGFFLHWHSAVCSDVNFNTIVPDPDNALKTLTYKDMSDLTGIFLFISMLCSILLIFLGFNLSSKKNLGTVISCTVATVLLAVFGGLYIYWIAVYFGGVDKYMDNLEKAMKSIDDGSMTEKQLQDQAQVLVGNKDSGYYIGTNGIFAKERASININYVLSVGSIIFCVISSAIGCVLGFIKYDRTYQKVTR